MATPGEAEPPASEEDRLRTRVAELEEEVATLRRAAADPRESPGMERDQAAAMQYHLMDRAPVGFVFFDTDLRFRAVSQQLAEINGLPAHEHIGRTIDEIIPGVAAKVRQAFQYVMTTGKPLVDGLASGELASAPGQLRHFSASWYPMQSPDGRLVGMGGIITEITTHKETEDALKRSQQSLALAQTAAGVGTYDWDIASGVGRCSENYCPLYGLPPNDLGPSYEEWAQLIHTDDRERVLEGARKQIEEGVPCTAEFRVVWPDGTMHWLFTKGNLIRDTQGNPSRTVGVTMDITERKIAEAALRESEERFRNLADTAPVMIWTAGPDHRGQFANRFALEFTGLTMEELTSEGWSHCVHPEDWQRLIPEWAKLRASNQGFHNEYRMRRADGEYRWVLATGTPRFLANGESAGHVGIAVDITEHKQAEQRLRDLSTALMRLQDEERRRIGRELHDSTGQNLAALKLNLSRLSHAELPPELERIVPDSLALTERMLIEIRTLSYLLHPPLLDELGLVSALKTYIEGFSGRSGIPVQFEAPPDLGRLAPELETAIFRIVQEGLTNAHRHSGSSQCWVAIQMSGESVSLVVRDDGAGLPAAVLHPLLNEPGRVGVGLPGMQERARQLGGTLEIESHGGCVIRAAFPLTRP
jgi:PAS domain S-box-containing protein